MSCNLGSIGSIENCSIIYCIEVVITITKLRPNFKLINTEIVDGPKDGPINGPRSKIRPKGQPKVLRNLCKTLLEIFD